MSIDRNFAMRSITREINGVRIARGTILESPQRRFPVALPRLERRRMVATYRKQRQYTRLSDIIPPQEARELREATDTDRLNKVDRLHLTLIHQPGLDWGDPRSEGDPWIAYADTKQSEVLAHAADVRTAIDRVTEKRGEGIW